MNEELINTISGLSLEQKKEALKFIYQNSLFHTTKYLLGFSKVEKDSHGSVIRCLESEIKSFDK